MTTDASVGDPWVDDDTFHQLRTPMTVLRLRLEYLMTSPGLDVEVADELRASLEDVDRLCRAVVACTPGR